MMPDISLEGQKANYIYGYFPREEPIPDGWVRTWRPCMECASAVTYIDSEKVWHCMRCGWRSDMGKKFTDEEIALIAKGLEMGKTIRRIADELDRDYGTVNQKIMQMRKCGLLTPNGAKAEAKAAVADGDVCRGEPKKARSADPLIGAWELAKEIGFELVSLRVSEGVATFTMSLKLGK